MDATINRKHTEDAMQAAAHSLTSIFPWIPADPLDLDVASYQQFLNILYIHHSIHMQGFSAGDLAQQFNGAANIPLYIQGVEAQAVTRSRTSLTSAFSKLLHGGFLVYVHVLE